MERERVAPLSGFIVIEIVQSVKEEGRKEGRKGLAQFPAAWRKRGGVREREREREMLVGTGAPLVIPRLKASFNIYDLFRFNSTCKREHAFIFRDVCLALDARNGIRKTFPLKYFSNVFEERISNIC